MCVCVCVCLIIIKIPPLDGVQESWPHYSLAAALRIAGPAPFQGNTVVLALMVKAQVSQPL